MPIVSGVETQTDRILNELYGGQSFETWRSVGGPFWQWEASRRLKLPLDGLLEAEFRLGGSPELLYALGHIIVTDTFKDNRFRSRELGRQPTSPPQLLRHTSRLVSVTVSDWGCGWLRRNEYPLEMPVAEDTSLNVQLGRASGLRRGQRWSELPTGYDVARDNQPQFFEVMERLLKIAKSHEDSNAVI